MKNFEFKNLLVRSLSLDYLEFTWEIQNTTLDPYDFEWTVERSESQGGPWDIMGGPFSDRYIFVDTRINQLSRNRKYHYRIKSQQKSDSSNLKYSDLVSQTANSDLIAEEIKLLEQTLFREYVGRLCWLLPVRTFGQYCPNCMDVDGPGSTFRKIRSNCLTCFDKRFVRGYMNPIEIYPQIDPSPKSVQHMQVGTTEQSNSTGRMGSFPALKPDDVIVEIENVRWRVVQVSTTQRLRSPVHQEFTVHEITKGDMEYRIPLNVDEALKDLNPSAERNFSMPENMESFENEQIQAILKAYGY